MDLQVQRLLQELGKVFGECIAQSPEARAAVRQMRQSGYTLRLVLDRCEDDTPGQIELASPPPREPVFRVDGQDVAFLKSLGIDATRPGRRRRS